MPAAVLAPAHVDHVVGEVLTETGVGENRLALGIRLCLQVPHHLELQGRKAGVGVLPAVFALAFVADLFTYIVTSFQLALAFPSAEGGFGECKF